ncbi:MAG: alkaline phosphatase family protein [Acidobacteria bacterium]|nr:alkaline phosphatase family protein [Acidobacteriota bacterium]
MRQGRRRTALIALAAIVLVAGIGVFLRTRHTTGPSAGSGSVIFVGLDGADWQYLDVLMTRDVMPNLRELVATGHGGALTTVHPPLSPLVWTTMMTGVSPLEHGILDFTRISPANGAQEPITSDERLRPAIWNMVDRNGGSTAVIGMWATHPAEEIRGLIVSERVTGAFGNAKLLPAGAVYPPAARKSVEALATEADQAVDLKTMQSYLPWLGPSQYHDAAVAPDPYSHPVSALHRILIETNLVTALAAREITREHPRLTIAYYQATDVVGHVFAPYAPPRQSSITQEDFERFGRVPELYFREIDQILGRYRAMAVSTGAVLMIASDHGFSWIESRPARLSSVAPATAAKWHRDEGIYLLWGDGIAPAPAHPGRGSVSQVCSTLLALLAMPPGKDLEWTPLPGAPPQVGAAVDYAATYERRQAAMPAPDDVAASEQLEKLRALGYIDKTATAVRSGSTSTRTAASFNNEGLIRRDGGDTAGAASAFERALEIAPDYASACWNLSELLFAEAHDLDRSDRLLIAALSHSVADGIKLLIGRCLQYQKAGRIERSVDLLDRAIKIKQDDADLRILRGRYSLERQDCRSAAADFEAATRLAPESAIAHASAGVANLCLGDRAKAASSFRRSLELDPNQPQIRASLQEIEVRPQ